MSDIHYQLQEHSENVPWVLLIHGLFGNLDNLASLKRGLVKNYSVLSVDLPDHGKSIRTSQFSFKHYAELIKQLLIDLRLNKINVVGHSLGGKIAMQMALDFPCLIDHVILMDIAPVEYLPRHENVFKALHNVPLEKITKRQQADEFLSKFIDEPSTRAFLLKSLGLNNDVWQWQFNLPLLTRDYAILSAGLNHHTPFPGPALFIKGALSDYIINEHRQKILSLFPHSQLKIVGGCGHWLHAEKPAICIKLIDDFIQQSSSTG